MEMIQFPLAILLVGIGALFALAIGQYIIAKIIRSMWIWLFYKNRRNPTYINIRKWRIHDEGTIRYTGWAGVTERLLYMAAFMYGSPEIIAAWVALKAAVMITAAIKGNPDPKQPIFTAPIGNIFLVGNALSILFAAAGALIAYRGYEYLLSFLAFPPQ